MKKHFLIVILICILSLFTSCSKKEILTPAEFTTEFVQTIYKTAPDCTVEIVKDLELEITSKNGRPLMTFLYNAYELYKQDPERKDSVIEEYAAMSMEILTSKDKKVDRKRIVPVIKDVVWLNESIKITIGGNDKMTDEHVYEFLNDDLVIIYGEDSGKSIRYLMQKDLEDIGLERKDLRALACENLKTILPELGVHGGEGIYMLSAGGDYESSLLLFSSMWDKKYMDVNGDFVVAVPSRDIVLVTGSEDKEGIRKIKELIKEYFDNESAYRITKKLFIYRDGKFTEFKE